jgi:hypothetical protein
MAAQLPKTVNEDIMPGYSQARIKSVLSGDTLILSNVNNPKAERTLSLAFVSAPRLKRDGDEASSAVHYSQL